MSKTLKMLIDYKNGKRYYPLLERWRIVKDIIEVLEELDKKVNDNRCVVDCFKCDGVGTYTEEEIRNFKVGGTD